MFFIARAEVQKKKKTVDTLITRFRVGRKKRKKKDTVPDPSSRMPAGEKRKR